MAKQGEMQVKGATDMVEGRLDQMKDTFLKEFQEDEADEDESGAGTFGIFGGSSSTASVVPSGGGRTNKKGNGNSKVAKASASRPSTEANPKVVAARFKKDTIKSYTVMTQNVQKAMKAGEEMLNSILETHEGSEQGAKTVPAYDVTKLRMECLQLLSDSSQGYDKEHIGQAVKEKLKKDPFFGPLSGTPQSLGFMNFTRNTCLELRRTAEHVNELSIKHKDRAAGQGRN